MSADSADGSPGVHTLAAEQRSQGDGRWWTEEVPRPYREGQRVTATRGTGGSFIPRVPKGAEGRITGTRKSLLDDKYATVEWDNGYTEEVPVDNIEPGRSWWQ